MTKSQILLMLEIMSHKRCCGTERDVDSKYCGMLEMFNQLICIEDKEICEAVIEYFITNDEVSGHERTTFAETVTSFSYFIDNYEKAINDGYIIDNVNAQIMIDVFKVFRNSRMMNVVFYEKFGTKAEYWNARLFISKDDYKYAMKEGNTTCQLLKPDAIRLCVTFDDGSKLNFGMLMCDNKVSGHFVSVKE